MLLFPSSLFGSTSLEYSCGEKGEHEFLDGIFSLSNY